MSRRRDRAERGFTVVEVLIALLVLLVGMAGILSLQLTSVQATGFSRHATEAAVLAEDKMELLRTEPFATLASGSDPQLLNPLGIPGQPDGFYAREWQVDLGPGSSKTITVVVRWEEQGDDDERFNVTLRTQRAP